MTDHLPEELEQITISGMLDGETEFTNAWAVYAEEDGTSWIRGDYSVYREPKGDAKLKIEKRSDRIAVYKETIGDYKYDRRGKPMDAWEPIPAEWVHGDPAGREVGELSLEGRTSSRQTSFFDHFSILIDVRDLGELISQV